ncbi:hypothetical protein [Rhodococcus sp. A14]|uniref:hypothetical protein n=1 Tax=Rhodococcus sp. A14 TaxID=1194106 RepID=UPI001420242E|nr:hypothetical protein [Rhodococcus sp. A14]
MLLPLRATRHRMRPWFVDFFALRGARGTIAPSLQAGSISSVTVVVSCLLFGPQLGAISLFGSMLALWEAERPLWARVRNGLLIASTMSVAMGLGVIVAPYRWATIPAIVLLILTAAVTYHAFLLTRGPVPFFCSTVPSSAPISAWTRISDGKSSESRPLPPCSPAA